MTHPEALADLTRRGFTAVEADLMLRKAFSNTWTRRAGVNVEYNGDSYGYSIWR